jgi:hypothetical protein
MCIPPIVARQRLGIHVPAATNARNKEEFLDALFSVGSVSYQSKPVGLSVYPVVARQWLGKHVPAATKIGGVVLYAVRVVSKESRRLVLPRTSINCIVETSV